MSQSAVSRIWRAFGLKPHRHETFKLSNDPSFVEKVRDVVGLYMSPPGNAVVVCALEKPSAQAIERTQAGTPALPGGTPNRHTRDYVRHGTTSLFAALVVATGAVIGKCQPRQRQEEFIAFLDAVDENLERESGVEVHLVMDNSSTHKTPSVKRWLLSHPEYRFHYTPTSSSWLNQVERFFSGLTERRLRHGSFASVEELERAIEEYIEVNNRDPKPFVWTKDADHILKNVARFCERTYDSGHYPVRVMLMPIIPIPEWQRHYDEFLAGLLSRVNVERLTLGGVCSYGPALQMTEAKLGKGDPLSRSLTVVDNEPGDGRARYPLAERAAIYRHLLGTIRRIRPGQTTALCMEEPSLARKLGLGETNVGRCNCIL